MKYVDSPSTNGGQLRVSSPLPGSSTLMTSAPMSPSIMAQNGPARTRVRSRTRIPARGALLFATWSSFPDTLRQALRDRVHTLAGAASAAPEEPIRVLGVQMREVVDVTHGLDCNPGADFQSGGLGAVADEAGAPGQLDERDVQRRFEATGRRVQRGEGDDVAGARHRSLRHLDRVTRAPPRGRRGDEPADRAAGGRQSFDHCSGVLEAGLYRGWPETDATRLRHARSTRIGIDASRLRSPDSSTAVIEPGLAGPLKTVAKVRHASAVIWLRAALPSCSCRGRQIGSASC